MNMRFNISSIVTSWIIRNLEASNDFRVFVRGVVQDFYVTSSLDKYRVWGDSSRISVGANVHLNNAVINTVSGTVSIGHNTFFGHNVSLLTGTHDYSLTGLARQTSVPSSGRDIVIEDGVWLASNTTVIGPCEIGENAVIAAGSVVIGNVASNSIYAGIPAKFIRTI